MTANGTSLSWAPISISYSVTGGSSWQDLTFVNTASDGSFSAEWLPLVTGNYLINATFAGDATHAKVSTVVSLAIVPYTSQNVQDVFSVTSNSTVSDLAFNSTSRELSFTVSGLNGTTGFVDIYIAKALVDDITNVKAYVDGKETSYVTTSTVDSWQLQFTCHLSKHAIVLDLGQTQSKPSTEASQALLASVAAALIVVAATIAIVLKRRRRSRNAAYSPA